MDSLNEYWNKVLELIKPEIPTISFNTWVVPLKPVSMEDNVIYLKANSEYYKTYVETRYKDLIKNAFRQVTNKECDISIILSENTKPTIKENTVTMTLNSPLNPKYTFDTFVIVKIINLLMQLLLLWQRV